MSGNRSRKARDFSAYDTMSTEELEKILQSDADAPEGEESDAELILHIMEVLVNRRNDTNNTGKTAAQAWEDFQQHYLPDAAETPPKKKRIAGRWLRCLTAAAAAVVLMVCIPLTASAFGWKDIWNIVATWAKETFSFVSGENASYCEPSPDYAEENTSFQEILDKNKVDAHVAPSWIPEGYVLESAIEDISPERETYIAYYTNGDKELGIRVQTYMSTPEYTVEIEGEILEVYTVSGVDYYIFKNTDQLRAIWTVDSYECNISGDLSIDELKKMIDSIEKG